MTFYYLCLLLVFSYCYGLDGFSSSRGITVTTPDGAAITSYSILQYQTAQHLRCKYENAAVKWSILPEGQGVVMSGNEIYISTLQVLPKTTFTITATFDGTSTTLPFDIEVYGCKYGNFTILGQDYKNNVTVYHESETVYSGSFTSLYLCIPRSTYRYSTVVDMETTFSISDESGIRLHTNYFTQYSTVEGTFSNDLSTPLSISFPSIISAFPSVEKKMLISVQGPVDLITI